MYATINYWVMPAYRRYARTGANECPQIEDLYSFIRERPFEESPESRARLAAAGFVDPWGNQLAARCIPGQSNDIPERYVGEKSFQVISSGPDGKIDTADDIRRF